MSLETLAFIQRHGRRTPGGFAYYLPDDPIPLDVWNALPGQQQASLARATRDLRDRLFGIVEDTR